MLVLHTAVNAWSLTIPVLVLPDDSNLLPFQIVAGILVLTAVALLLSGSQRMRAHPVQCSTLCGTQNRVLGRLASLQIRAMQRSIAVVFA